MESACHDCLAGSVGQPAMLILIDDSPKVHAIQPPVVIYFPADASYYMNTQRHLSGTATWLPQVCPSCRNPVVENPFACGFNLI